MNIIHICLACFYVEGWGYQENILPRIHMEMGNKVTVLTSDYAFNTKYGATVKENKDYYNEAGIHVKVLDRKRVLGREWYGAFGGIYENLEELNPDVIFVHGGQFVSLKDVINYCKQHPEVKMYIDQHGDYYNMPVGNWDQKVSQKLIYGHYIRKAVKYTSKFWGVTPWRCQYLNDIYGVPKNKIDLLVMGADDEKIHFDQMPELRDKIRNELGLQKDDFVVITGGKIDRTKNIHLLMQAVAELNQEHLKLVVFGQPNDDMKAEIDALSKDAHICNIGWLDSALVYDYFLASDLVVFPGTHSVLWEQACGCGIPVVVKDWEGMHHVDLGGNCIFLKQDSVQEMKDVLLRIYHDHDAYEKMKKVAVEQGIPTFSYKEIAKRAIGIEN